ncbi:hypothetical protein ABZ527_38305 [Streptomyces griseofuscus]|uniref:hypothetical protein n=1 Tax=Streptomyces griseofuscus TaxID=146922 RepID=UPI003403345E
MNRDHPTVSVTLDKALHATVLGLPVKFTPGSGWHDFTLRLANVSHKGITSVAIYLDMDLHAWSNLDDTSSLLTAQWYDKDAGVWKDMLDDGYFSYCLEPHLTVLAPGEYVDTQLRLQVDARMLDGFGTVGTLG